MPATVFLRNKHKRFATRVGGYARSHKIWTCRRCRAWHEHAKPKRCERCGHPEFLFYDSGGEARWFVGLMRELDNGSIAELVHHPRYPIHVAGSQGIVQVFDYVADAEYLRAGELITGDFKPKSLEGLDPVFLLKRKCFEAEYGRSITITTER